MRELNLKYLFILFFLIICNSTVFAQVSFTASSTSGCPPFSVQFTNTSAAGSYTWDFGNGNTSTNFNASAVYNDPGSYVVVLTGPGGATASTTIQVFQNPSASFTVPDDTICTNGQIIFNSTSVQGTAPIVLYIWSFGDGDIDSSTTPTINHTYSIGGNFTTNLVVIDQNNCQSQSINFPIRAIQRPTASFTLNPAGSCTVPVTVNFTNTSTPTANYTYSWNFDDPSSGANNTSTLANPSHTYSANNTYNVSLVVALGGCADSISIPFSAQQLNADFTVSEDSICPGETVDFTDTSVPVATSYIWNFGDPASGGSNFSTLQNPSHLFNNPGTYSVLLTASLGNCTDSIRRTIVVRDRPSVRFNTTSDSTNCQAPFTVNFSGVSTSVISNWSWVFGDGGTGSGQNTGHTYNSTGVFSVTLTVTDQFGCTNSFTKFNHVEIERPTVEILTLPDSGCVGTTFNFQAQATFGPGDSAQTITWDFGDGTGPQVGGLTTSHTFNTPGIFDVSVTIVTANGCTVTDVEPALIRIGVIPNANFSWTPSVMCYGDTVFFTDLSTIPAPATITGWLWSFNSTEQNPTYVFPDTGIYDVTLIAFNNGCADTLLQEDIITIHPPRPEFSATFNCQNPFTVEFTDLSRGDTWLRWNFGDGSPVDSTNAQTPTHTFPGRGNYIVTLTAYNSVYGCQKDTTLQVQITVPVADINATPAGCYPFTSTVTAGGSQDASFYNWNFGDPGSGQFNNSLFPDTLHRYANPGAYLMTLTITDVHGCTDQDTLTVFSNGPTAAFSAPVTSGCRPFTPTFNFTGTTFGSAIANYSWNFNFPNNNDIVNTAQSPYSHVFSNRGNYSVQLTVTDGNGCSASTLQSGYISVTFPDANLNGLDTFVCDNVLVPLSVNFVGSGPFTVAWDFGDGTADTVQTNVSGSSSTMFHSYPTNNTVNTLSVTVTDVNGCDTTISRPITVLAPDPTFTATSADSCGYTTTTFLSNTTTSINQWNWNIFGPFNYNGVSALPNPQFQYTIPGWYGATLTVSNPGCTRSFTEDSLFLVPGPQGFFTYIPDSGCSPITIDFNTTIITGSYDFIQWDFGDGTTSETNAPGTSITHTYYQDGTFFPRALIAYTVNGRQCLVNDTNLTGAAIVVSTVLGVNATPDVITTAAGSRDTLSATVTDPNNNAPYTYSWNAGPGSGTFNPIGGLGNFVEYTAGSNNNYVVVTVRDNSGCQAYDTIQVVLEPCDFSLDSIPNVFTPDSDGRNDQYYIENLCPSDKFKIVIYNRWGRLIYESDDPFFRWDGRTTGGTEASDGTYYYILTLQNRELNGWIQLIRNSNR